MSRVNSSDQMRYVQFAPRCSGLHISLGEQNSRNSLTFFPFLFLNDRPQNILLIISRLLDLLLLSVLFQRLSPVVGVNRNEHKAIPATLRVDLVNTRNCVKFMRIYLCKYVFRYSATFSGTYVRNCSVQQESFISRRVEFHFAAQYTKFPT